MNIGEAERRRQSSILAAQGLLRRAADIEARVAFDGYTATSIAARVADLRRRAADLLIEAGVNDLDPVRGAQNARENIQDEKDDKDYRGER